MAKHTAVDGISDIDALVVLDASAVGAATGKEDAGIFGTAGPRQS